MNLSKTAYFRRIALAAPPVSRGANYTGPNAGAMAKVSIPGRGRDAYVQVRPGSLEEDRA
jgi:hypothetical protein